MRCVDFNALVRAQPAVEYWAISRADSFYAARVRQRTP